jgi:hypothetical protein
MKPKLLLTISLLFLFSHILFAQDTIIFKAKHPEKIKLFSLYPGYVITKKGDTLKGYLMLKNLISNQDKVWFYKTKDTPKKEAVKYKPKDIKAYKVGPRYYESHKFWPNVSTYVTNNTRGYHFILKVIDGPLSMYRWFYEDVATSDQRVNIDFSDPASFHLDLSFSENDLPAVPLVKKGDGEVIFLYHGFRKAMLKLVSDDPELAEKIKNKELGRNDLEQIIKEYNEWYLSHH